MVNEDVKKFINVFMEINSNGNIVDFEDYMESYVLSKIPNNYLDNWKKCLSRKFNEYDEKDDIDGYDDWYDSIKTIDDIDYKDIRRYDLPESIIKVNFGDEVKLVTKLYDIYKSGIDKLKPYCEDPNKCQAEFIFSKSQIMFALYSYTINQTGENKSSKEDRKLITNAKNIFLGIKDEVFKLQKEYNDTQGEDGMIINIQSNNSNTSSNSQQNYDKGGFILNSSCEYILSLDADTYSIPNTSDMKTYNDFIDRLFNIIPYERCLANPNII